MNDARGRAWELLAGFLDRTGVTSERPPRRYLWTDAFAVCTLLALDRVDLALRLVEQVHEVLGRHREHDPRTGWISGLREEEGRDHPTIGGLRIGKPLPERRPTERFDEILEWERDGQYFHYLTRWAHALDQLARRTGEPSFAVWARELTVVGHRAFTEHAPGGPGSGRMAWKLSVDLSRPLVDSMGLHDPLDGYVTCLQLEATAARLGIEPDADLTGARADFATMIPAQQETPDPLGIGGFLADAWRLRQVAPDGPPEQADLCGHLLDAAVVGLETWTRTGELARPAATRLAFRELGLAIGLAALPKLAAEPALTAHLLRFVDLREPIIACWSSPEHQAATSWLDHLDINEVTLAAGLVPQGYLTLVT